MFPRTYLRWPCLLAAALCLPMSAPSAQTGTFANPIHPNAADPFVTFANGSYYLLCTDTANDPFESTRPHHLTIRAAPSLGGLSTALAENRLHHGPQSEKRQRPQHLLRIAGTLAFRQPLVHLLHRIRQHDPRFGKRG